MSSKPSNPGKDKEPSIKERDLLKEAQKQGLIPDPLPKSYPISRKPVDGWNPK